MKEANAVIAEVTASLENTQANANVAAAAAQEAQAELNQMKTLVESVTTNLVNIQKVASGAQAQLVERNQLLEAARMRVANVTRRVSDAQQDFDKTKDSATKAACAAMEAQQKVKQRSRRSPSEKEQQLLTGGSAAKA